ncbi:MAG: zinc-dependent alcohol dehydrogenase family protein [Anaerolineae bacterium]
MRAMLLSSVAPLEERPAPLRLTDLPIPAPEPDEILIKVAACGVCHTELDEIEGRTAPPVLPVVPGHQVIGRVAALGADVHGWRAGEPAGAAWIHHACGICRYCRSGRENLCADFRATGRDANGGYAEYLTIPADFAYHLPEALAVPEMAPLLCAGAVGYRALQLCALQNGQVLALAGFGASAQLVLPMARHLYPGSPVYVVTRSAAGQARARELGAVWAGGYEQAPPALIDAAIDTTPVWSPVLAALGLLAPGGRLVVNAIGKEESDKRVLLELDYQKQLWLEKSLQSVANVTRADVRACLALAERIHLHPAVQFYPLEQANEALLALKQGKIRGSAVLRVG